MELAISAWRRHHTPFGKIPRDLRRQRLYANTEPLCSNWPKARVKVCAGPVEIYAEHKRWFHACSRVVTATLLESSSSQHDTAAAIRSRVLVGAPSGHVLASHPHG